MRRILAISLLLLFALPMAAPLLALSSSDSDANLPICCRRNGKHHCMMSMERAQAALHGTQLSALTSTCPFYPAAAATSQHFALWLFAAALLFAGILAHPALHRQTEARARVASHCARQKRGPPALCLA